MMNEPRVTNEPPGILALDAFDRRTWWVGAIAQEAALFDLIGNRLLREMVADDSQAVAKHDARKKDLMFRELKESISAEARRLAEADSHPELAVEIQSWIDTLSADKRNRVIHDVAMATERGIESFDSRGILGGQPKSLITVTYLDEVFREIQAQTIQAEHFWSDASRAWGARR